MWRAQREREREREIERERERAIAITQIWFCTLMIRHNVLIWARLNGNIELINTLLNFELNKSPDWLAWTNYCSMFKITKFKWYHYRQGLKRKTTCLVINNTLTEEVAEFYFIGLTLNGYMNWNSHAKTSNKTSCTLCPWHHAQAETILAYFSHAIDLWFIDRVAPPIWTVPIPLQMYVTISTVMIV